MNIKIRDQLIIFFSITIISSIGVTAYFTITYTESGALDAEIAKMKIENEQVVEDMDNLHVDASEDLIFVLKNPKFVEYFELPETKAGNVYDENGVLQFTDNQRKIKRELEQWIYPFQNKFSIDETCIIDLTGQEHVRVVLTKIESDEHLSSDEKSTPFFAPTFMKQKDEVNVQYPYVSPDTNRWVFAYSSPIELGNGQKPAFFHLEMPITIFQELLKIDSGRMYVLDPAGYVVADSLGTVTDKVISFEPENQFTSFQAVSASGLDVLEQMKSNDRGDGMYLVNGEEHYFVYEKLSTFDWILVYEKPASSMLIGINSVTDLAYAMVLISLGVAGFGIFGIVFISSRISRPIHRLAEQIAEANPERLEEIDPANHEVGMISKAVNKLMKKMTLYQEDINLKNHELTIQKQQLERLAKVGELASRLTHNLRTPLTVIKSTVDVLKYHTKDSLDEKSLQRLDRIKSASENLEKQIEEVLTFVRNKPLDLKNISFKKLLEDTLKNIDLPESVQVIFPKEDQIINCDPDKMQIVFMNMISNSIDALDKEGNIRIEITSNEIENMINIIDNGNGISPENLTRVFDSLFTTKSTGTGLGLPYCKSVIEQHGGTILVSVNPTTFTITIPKKIISMQIM